MKLFISWSKETSHAVALALHEWLPMAVPSVLPWVSSEDIAKGTRGRDAIVKELAGTGQGVICLTRQNVKEPWLNFEAGALSNHAVEPRVRTVLFDLKPRDVVGPLSDFQHTDLNDKGDVLKLVHSINETSEQQLSERQLTTYFDRFWGDLVTELGKIREAKSTLPVGDDGAPARNRDQLLEEVLERVRTIERYQRDLAQRVDFVGSRVEYMNMRYEQDRGFALKPLEAHLPEQAVFIGQYVADEQLGIGEIIDKIADNFAIRFSREKQTVRVPMSAYPADKIFTTREQAQKYLKVRTRAARVREGLGGDPGPASVVARSLRATIDDPSVPTGPAHPS